MKNSTHLTTLSAVDSAKALRKALRAAFPGTKFSVRLSRGTAYGNASISWTGGPDAEAIHDVARPFTGDRFDGMQDLQYTVPTRIEWEGEEYRSGLNLVLVYRTRTDEERAASDAAREARLGR